MGRLSQVLSFDCRECSAEVDERYAQTHRHVHKCRSQDIDWDETPDFMRSPEFIAWYGTCEVCGRRVYDCYVAQPTLYDSATNEKV